MLLAPRVIGEDPPFKGADKLFGRLHVFHVHLLKEGIALEDLGVGGDLAAQFLLSQFFEGLFRLPHVFISWDCNLAARLIVQNTFIHLCCQGCTKAIDIKVISVRIFEKTSTLSLPKNHSRWNRDKTMSRLD
jgi:hypothetical protein